MGRERVGEPQTHGRRAFAATAGLAVAVAIAIVSAGSAGADEPTGPVARAETADGAEEAVAYWTPERMDEAQPADLIVEGGSGPAAASAREGDVELLNHPISFTRTELTDTTAFPARVHGRVFFTKGMSNFSCSGTVVSTPAGNAVITAGHCVFDAPGGTGFVQDWVFVPGFRDPDGTGVGNPPETPFGTIAATALIAPTGWTQGKSVSFDFGAALLAPTSGGDPVESVVGARGIAFNQRRSQAYRSFGYPAAAPFDGSRLYVCDSRYGGDAPVAVSGPRPMALGCDMNQGSSGGGWVARDTFVESVNSFLLSSHPEVLYGPHLEGAARNLYGSPGALAGWRCRGKIPTMVGTAAGETIAGSARADVIFAGGGNDVVKSKGGRDLVCGAAGADTLKGGRGRGDRCIGGGGSDQLARSCERRRQ